MLYRTVLYPKAVLLSIDRGLAPPIAIVRRQGSLLSLKHRNDMAQGLTAQDGLCQWVRGTGNLKASHDGTANLRVLFCLNGTATATSTAALHCNDCYCFFFFSCPGNDVYRYRNV